MLIRHAWYVAALPSEIGRTPLARTILGEPVVLYRKRDGAVVALRDRCCHRLLPLSVGKVIDDLKEMGFDYIVCDSPAGIETGALMAAYFADDALVVTNPEVSSVRDSDRILGILAAKSKRAIDGPEPVKVFILAGQSNMEGHGFVAADAQRNGGKGSLEYVAKQPGTAERFKHLLSPDGNWGVRDDVWIVY